MICKKDFSSTGRKEITASLHELQRMLEGQQN